MNILMTIYLSTLLITVILVFYRLAAGPTAPDRTVAIDILGIILLNICVILSMLWNQDFYITAGIVISVLNFAVTLALAKFLEGKKYNE